jgi:DNA repair protein RadC
MYAYTFTRKRIADAPPAARCDTPELLAQTVAPLLDDAETERLVVVALDRKHKAIGAETVYVGTVSGTSVRIAELFRLAVRLNASGIAIAHNHPSGDPSPSADDIRTTRDAVSAGRLLGIEVVDHLVYGDAATWVSMRRAHIGFGLNG